MTTAAGGLQPVNGAGGGRGDGRRLPERIRTKETSDPPRPDAATSLDDIASALLALRSWAGNPSFSDITRRVAQLREPSERPGRVTVYDCFRAGRRRMAADLLRDVVLALGCPEAELAHWLSAHRRVTGAAPVTAPARALLGLPGSPDRFVGRAAEFAAIVAAPAGAVTVISGMPGSGKTELALACAQRIAALRPQPVLTLFVDLRGDGAAPVDVAAALESLLRLLDVPSAELASLGTDGLAARLRARLASVSAVLVLDNAADVDVVRQLLPGARHVRVLVTSRRALAGLTHVRLEAMDVEDALRLLASSLDPAAITREPAAARRIVELCGALPLDLRLAAATIASRPGWTLDDHARRLASQPPGASVRPALTTAYDQLTAREQQLLRALTLHPGRIVTAHAAAALVNGSLVEVTSSLTRLDDERLVRLVDGRATLHDLVAAFAAERLILEDPFSGQRAALERLYEHYLDAARLSMRRLSLDDESNEPAMTPIAQRADWLPELPDERSALAWLKAELSSLLAVATSAAADHPVTLSDLAETLATYLVANGLYRDARRLHELALAHGVPSRAGDAHRRLGRIAEQLGDYAEALRHLGRAAELTGDDDPKMHNALGNIAKRLGQYDEANGFFARAADLARDQGLDVTRGRAIGNLADTLRIQGQHGRAHELYAQALDLARTSNDSLNQAIVTANSALLAGQRGDHETSLRLSNTSIAIATEFGHTGLLPRTIQAAGSTAMQLGDLDGADRLLAEARRLAVELGQREVECEISTASGRLLTRQGKVAAAVESLTADVELAVLLGSPQLKIDALNALATAELSGGSLDAAAEHFSQALTLATETGDQIEVAVAECGLGDVFLADADGDAALVHWGRARDHYARLERGADVAALAVRMQGVVGEAS